MARDDASQRQVDAARPDRSTWLAANAGSGKTRVLTDRVARLLLDGVDPQHILCLTYTKAAASEMQNRLFNRLGGWAMLPARDLTAALEALGYAGGIDGDALRRARRLFARAIETPGGLKIQTIHSFCAGLLRRFPLEAGVTPNFTEMEERTATLLRGEIVEEIADGPQASVLHALARHHTGDSLDRITAEIVHHRTGFAAPLSDTRLAAILGQPMGLTAQAIARMVFRGGEEEILDALIPALLASGTRDQGAGESLKEIGTLDLSALPILERVFLTGASAKEPFSAKIGSFPTKKCREGLGSLLPRLEDWMRRVEDAREARLALAAMQKARALHDFAAVFLPAYDAAKARRGLLDFDDLILKARDLLTNAEVAAWVLYRLDGGIDHILVDEAQDTSPLQWQVIERLSQEFTSGAGARPEVTRTIFVVGDKKQSIYSFQGADPGAFDRMRADFGQRLSDAGTPLQAMEMAYSFRSAQAILTVVDHTFADRAEAGFTQESPHMAFKADLPGRVDLWPVIEPPDKPEEPPWHTPVDVKASDDPAVLLARQVAARIRGMIDTGQTVPDPRHGGMRPVRPGDVMVLVQRRSSLFHEIIRECKAAGLPIAGADRLKVGGELAVRDLAALLSFLATPEDSLALATALRSPLFGWSEAQLFDLAHKRDTRHLWPDLQRRGSEFPETLAVLHDLRDHADYLRPYDLLERILTRHDGRRRLLARLGAEAEDGIDALLSQAMRFEQQAVGSLTGFLVWMETDDLEIKRQLDNAGDRIRVMTVHGAKGLESPVVILPDSARRDIRPRGNLIAADGTVLWRMPAEESPAPMKTAIEGERAAERAERDRLLYVAMTRAESWLIVGAAGDLGRDGESWYDKVRTGLERAGAAEHSFALGAGLRYEMGDWHAQAAAATDAHRDARPALPAWCETPAPVAEGPPETLSPSQLGGAKALPGEAGLDEEAAKRRGRQIHRLLEFLPQSPRPDWPETAARLLGQGPDAADPDERALLLAEAEKVLTRPSLAPLFAPDALAEVPVTAPLAELGGRRIHGTIDRLVVEPGRILAVDFKTNAEVPGTPAEVPECLLRQMGAYALALAQVYPDRRIETALLWTRTATLMRLPHDLVTRALAEAGIA